MGAITRDTAARIITTRSRVRRSVTLGVLCEKYSSSGLPTVDTVIRSAILGKSPATTILHTLGTFLLDNMAWQQCNLPDFYTEKKIFRIFTYKCIEVKRTISFYHTLHSIIMLAIITLYDMYVTTTIRNQKI